ncbi:MAG: helix-turn-helix transcriptional regulator [Ignavibacteriae bacterium]|nr:XRE family transcriptional regulator [Ignavibacteriota bacterium]NOG99156.1 helix-turn-helix transcriptional regulator [Ignavibacteriota bacterium]
MSRFQLASEIKKLRLSKSWSQQQLADISGLSLRTIQRIEKDGKCSHESLLTLASIFELDVESFTEILDTDNSKILDMFNKYALFNFLKGVKSKSIALISLVFVLPALYFAVANILYYYLNISFMHSSLEYIYNDAILFKVFNFISPFIFIGGIFLTIYLNLSVLVKFNLQKRKNDLIGTFYFSNKIPNLLVLLTAGCLLFLFVGYVLLENFILI